MKIQLENLPSETNNLHQIIASLSAENESLSSQNLLLNNQTTVLDSQITNLTIENQLLLEQLKLLRAKMFGKSSEKLDQQIQQLELWIEENQLDNIEPEENESSADTEEKTQNKEKKRPKRKKLPDHLPREDVILNPDSECPECGGTIFRKINDDISEVLEHIPESFKVVRYIRPRCVCIKCENIVQAYAPSKTIDKGKAGPGLLAHILVQKYCNHLPIYRQHQMYLREGIDIPETTMTGWAWQCAKLLEPLIEELRKSIFSSKHLHGDDTPVKVLGHGLGKAKIGRIWVYVRDGRPYGDKTPPAAYYIYTSDRKGIRPQEHLADFKGIFHADAYAGYDKIYLSEAIKEAACWAHTRRKFYEITISNDKASIAFGALAQISKIYKIEKSIKGLDPGERLKHRQKKSKKLVRKLFIYFKKYRKELPQKSTTVQAINYALNNEVALKRFLEDGKIEIDNSAAERAMKPLAVGRKNWLFAGSDNGGHTAAGIFSLIETVKMNGINPNLYLKKVLEVIQDYNSAKIADLLPWNLKL